MGGKSLGSQGRESFDLNGELDEWDQLDADLMVRAVRFFVSLVCRLQLSPPVLILSQESSLLSIFQSLRSGTYTFKLSSSSPHPFP
jgi:hypothetical protein